MDDTTYQKSNGKQGQVTVRPVSESIPNFSRGAWSSPVPSRSSSPSSRGDEFSTRDGDSTTTAASSTSSACPASPDSKSKDVDTELSGPRKLSKNGRRASISSLKQKSRRPLSMMFSRAPASDPLVTTAGVGKQQSVSVDSLPSANVKSFNRKSRDECWDLFRTLETDYSKFQNKSSTQKANVIRGSLLPFLRIAPQKSCGNIEPDELDRRVRVLHRWWTGLLAQLQNRSANAIAGSDRQMYLEGVSGLMSRPEWRPPQSEFSPLAEQISKSQSSTSLASDVSRYSVQKSVQHNIKTLFTRTLIDTMAFAVEKMSQRTAPATLVAFAGKVVAYAFFFCPGAAEILISLWHIPPGAVTRAVQQFGIGRATDLRGVSEDIVMGFPETLHTLGFSTLGGTLRQLKKTVKPPLGNSVNWYGDWTNRWIGRDSDLLFVFLKHFHILMCEFLPPSVTSTARTCAPAFVLVQAHILNILDNTIHKQTAKPAAGPPGASLLTFDDVLAKVSTIPVPMGRNMSENKIVVLLRDVATDRQSCTSRCRNIIAESLSAMMMAAAQRTKVFDADACFALCDVMEELLPILNFAEKLADNGAKYIDWTFWLNVMKRMAECDNNMTELRLICMVYSIWRLLIDDEDRKRALCIDWLLTPVVWDKFFCHWCPMVRAYFMRLICWRVSRYDGSQSSGTDKDVLKALALCLRTSNAQHLKLKDKAEKGLIPAQLTNPCLPAPGRRLIILRNDTLAPPPGTFLSHDGIIMPTAPAVADEISPAPSPTQPKFNTKTAQRPVTPVKSSAASMVSVASSTTKRRWSILRTLGLQNDSPPPPSPPQDTKNQSKGGAAEGKASSESTESAQTSVDRRATFKFSLEWMAQQPFSVRDKHLSPDRLPAASQNYLNTFIEDTPIAVDIKDTLDAQKSHWTYAGRAMAEWVLVLVEYENFFERRRSEGKENDTDIETPSLGVESLRKM